MTTGRNTAIPDDFKRKFTPTDERSVPSLLAFQPRYLIIAGMLAILASFLSCIPADVQAIRKDDQERDQLADAARLYWEGVRWEVDDQSADFIDEENRALFRSRVEEQRKMERIIEATILKVTVNEAPVEQTAKTDSWRTGTVLVKLEGYTLPAQIVRIEEVSQEWNRTPDGWFLQWDPEAPGPLTGTTE